MPITQSHISKAAPATSEEWPHSLTPLPYILNKSNSHFSLPTFPQSIFFPFSTCITLGFKLKYHLLLPPPRTLCFCFNLLKPYLHHTQHFISSTGPHYPSHALHTYYFQLCKYSKLQKMFFQNNLWWTNFY